MTRERLTVTAQETGIRLDLFLAARCPGRSRAFLQKLIRDGRARISGHPLKASHPMSAGEVVDLEVPEPVPLALAGEAIPLSILYEDTHIIAIDKPAGMTVHPGAGASRGTLVHALLHHCRDLSGIGGVERPGIVHRLDKDTSGVIVAAKTDAAHHGLVDQFASRTVTKLYEAVVWGTVERGSGVIEIAIGRDRISRKKISPRTTAPRDAYTEYRVKEPLAGFSWLEVRPRTGRTHQIRVHLLHAGHPIVGDTLYGGAGRGRDLRDPARREALARFHRLALHARRLEILHPVTREPLAFEAALPGEVASLIEALRRP